MNGPVAPAAHDLPATFDTVNSLPKGSLSPGRRLSVQLACKWGMAPSGVREPAVVADAVAVEPVSAAQFPC
jgi:hypothetical protein